jgi:hypothetical protein
VNFFNTEFDLAASSVHFSGDFVIAIIGWLTNFLKVPLQILVNEFFQPIVNFVINDFIIPGILENGLLRIDTMYDGKKVDTMIVDATLPQSPVFSKGTMDVFTDAAIYFEKHGRRFPAPTTPMRFQLLDQNFQLVLSSFSMNQIVQTVIDTELLVVPVNHHLIQEFFGLELTTTILFPIIPQLFYNYGHRNVSLVIKPLTETMIDWSNAKKQTSVRAKVLAGWQIHEGSDNAEPLL